LPGIKSASVNYADTSLQVEFIPEDISPAEMKKAVQSIGYDIIIDEANIPLLNLSSVTLKKQ
jgi:Cu2+-exporting ATPase